MIHHIVDFETTIVKCLPFSTATFWFVSTLTFFRAPRRLASWPFLSHHADATAHPV
jgi:hypothetical protein